VPPASGRLEDGCLATRLEDGCLATPASGRLEDGCLATPENLAPILDRLGIDRSNWVNTVRDFGRMFKQAAG
jgi:hypothetical protein